jgi:hypothetical protein
VLKAMSLTKLKIATVALLAVALLGTGAGVFLPPGVAGKPPAEPVKAEGKKDATEVSGVVKAVDASRNTLTLHPGKQSPEQTFTLAGDVEVFLDDGTGDKLGFQKGKPTDLIEGAVVTLRLSENQKVFRVWVEGPTIQGVLKSVDAANSTITATVALSKIELATEKVFSVAKNARIFIDDGPVDKTKPTKQPRLADLPANVVVFLKLSAGRKTVGSIRAEGQTVTGGVKAVDGAKNTITVTISVKGEPDVDRTFPVVKAAPVFIDDGKPIDKTKPAHSLTDLPVGARVVLRLALDGQSVVAVRAEGSHVYGTVKAVNAAKGTVTLHDKTQDEKTYEVMKDALVFSDGTEVKKLAHVPVGANVELKLLADQKTVREIRAYGPTVMGSVVGTAGNNSITLCGKEGDATYTVAKGARVLIEEKTEGKLTDLIDGTVAQARLTADKSTVLELRAEGPTFYGTIKALDLDKNTFTVAVGAKMGMGGEDKDFKVTKDTVVLSQGTGADLKLKDLKTDKDIILRLSIDQKAVNRITVIGE